MKVIEKRRTKLICILLLNCVTMGRWDDGSGDGFYGGYHNGGDSNRKKRNWYRIIKRVIFVGFALVAAVVLYVYFTTAGLNAEVIQRGGPVETISIKLSNNNFYSISNVTVQFDTGQVQKLGDLGPFASVFITPDGGSSNFKQLLVKANNGQIEYIKKR